MLSRQPPRLPLHEWCIIALFCAILALLAAIAFQNKHKPPEMPILAMEAPLALLQVTVKGAVANSGTYRMPPHALLKDVLAQARPLDNADLSKLRLQRKVRDGQTIYIPEKYLMTIYLEGAVKQPGPFEVPSGTRWQDLADWLEVLPDADLRPLRKKRSYLQEGDTVVVPAKPSPKNRKKQRHDAMGKG